jgi:hypothetical protein
MSKPLRDSRGRLLPGQAPLNPGGRPKSLRNEIEQRFGPNASDAWDCLNRIMTGREESIEERVLADGRIIEVRKRPSIAEKQAAAELAIAYVEGRPATTNLNANVNVTPAAMDDATLKARVAEMLARFATSPALPEHAPTQEIEIQGERVPLESKR